MRPDYTNATTVKFDTFEMMMADATIRESQGQSLDGFHGYTVRAQGGPSTRDVFVEDRGADDDYHAQYVLTPFLWGESMLDSLAHRSQSARIEYGYDNLVAAMSSGIEWLREGDGDEVIAYVTMVDGEQVVHLEYKEAK